MPSPPRPLCSRRMDQLYFYFFCHMIPVILFIDSVPFIPTYLVTPPGRLLHNIYKEQFADPLQQLQPPWFYFFAIVEFLVQLPLCIWAVSALRRDSPLVPLGVGIYGALLGFTTWTAIVEVLAFNEADYGIAEYPWQRRLNLSMLYGSYAVVGTWMAVDMGFRIKKQLLTVAQTEGSRKLK